MKINKSFFCVTSAITVGLATLKLLGVISIGWIAVFSPIIFWLAVSLLIIIMVTGFMSVCCFICEFGLGAEAFDRAIETAKEKINSSKNNSGKNE